MARSDSSANPQPPEHIGPPSRPDHDAAQSATASGRAKERTHPVALIVTAITAAIALISGGAGLVFDFWPSLRPDPRTELGSKLAVVTVERNVTFDDYLRRRGGSEARYQQRRAQEVARAGSSAGLQIRGELAYVQVAVHGFKRRQVSVYWSIYDARREERKRTGTWQAHWRLDAPADTFVDELWLPPVVGSATKYFVRIEVRGPNGVLLALADSRPFRGLAVDA
jgi:hypothetical protein